jgi:tellurite resistance protein
MQMSESEVYGKLLAAVAAADGFIDERELRKLAQLVKLDGGDPLSANALCVEAVASRESPLKFMEGLTFEPAFAKKCLRDGLLICFIDQNTAESEMELLHHASVLLGVEGDFERIAAMHAVADTPISLAARSISPLLDEDLHLRLLAAVVAADGEFEDAERLQLRKIVRVLGFDPRRASRLCDEALERTKDPLWFLPEVPPEPEVVERMLKDCAILVGRGGRIGAAERRIIDEAARRLGVVTPTGAFDEVEQSLRDGLLKFDAIADSVFQLEIPPALIMVAGGLMAVVAPVLLLRDQMGTASGFLYIAVMFVVAVIGMFYLEMQD